MTDTYTTDFPVVDPHTHEYEFSEGSHPYCSWLNDSGLKTSSSTPHKISESVLIHKLNKYIIGNPNN